MLRGPFDACVDFAAKRAEVDGLGEKRLGAILECRPPGPRQGMRRFLIERLPADVTRALLQGVPMSDTSVCSHS